MGTLSSSELAWMMAGHRGATGRRQSVIICQGKMPKNLSTTVILIANMPVIVEARKSA